MSLIYGSKAFSIADVISGVSSQKRKKYTNIYKIADLNCIQPFNDEINLAMVCLSI